MKRHFIVAILFLLSCNTVYAQVTGPTDSLLLRYELPSADVARTAPQGFLVCFRQYPSPRALQAHGVVKALTQQHFIVQQCSADTLIKKEVLYCVPANANWKASTVLLQQIEQLRPQDSITLQIAYTGNTAANWQQLVRIKRNLPQYHAAVVTLTRRNWPALISLPDVQYADIVRKPSTEIVINTANPYLNRINAAHQAFPGIRGNRIAISVKEDLFDTLDLDLVARYIPTPGTSRVSSSHATIMATLMAGAGNSGDKGLGVAPAARLASADFNVSLFPDEDNYFRQTGISLQNHSYGSGINNVYSPEAAAYDQQTYQSDTILHVFSSGNSGALFANDGLYKNIPGLANLTGNYKQAKNLLLAGGTDGNAAVGNGSSKGPTYDGRVKPDIVVFGEDGTSGAAAMTSGAAALLQESLVQQNGRYPSAALLRALIINSTWSANGIPLSYSSGYGNLDMLAALQAVRDKRYLSGSVNARSTATFELTVPPGTAQARVTLCWNDPPAAVNAPKALVNDLDMQVKDAAGATWQPWVLSIFPKADSLRAAPHRGKDTLNNTEQVTISRPAAGKLQVTVRGTSLATAQQAFHLSYSFTPLNTFAWLNPAGGEIFQAVSMIPLQWSTTYPGTGDISYSLDSGVTWNTVAQGVPLANGRYNWPAPDTFSKVWLRLSLPDTTFNAPVAYISPRLSLRTGYNCEDSALVFWNPQPGAVAYQVMVMNNAYLSSYTLTRDTFFYVPKKTVSAQNFAVTPVAAAGWNGLRSYATNYTLQGVECYIATFLADRTNDNKVMLQLMLGTTAQLRNISWERRSGGGYQTLAVTPISNTVNYSERDDTPPQGLSYYRVRLETTGGRIIYSHDVAVIINTGTKPLLFPNPVTNILRILMPDFEEKQVVISDMNGRRILQRTLTNQLEGIGLEQLAPGLYNCTIFDKGKRVFTGKFVKL